MRRQFYFTRLYTRVIDEPVVRTSLVAFRKKPYAEKVYTRYSSMDFSDEGVRKTYVSQYEYGLHLNFWLVAVRLEWVGREQKAPK